MNDMTVPPLAGRCHDSGVFAMWKAVRKRQFGTDPGMAFEFNRFDDFKLIGGGGILACRYTQSDLAPLVWPECNGDRGIVVRGDDDSGDRREFFGVQPLAGGDVDGFDGIGANAHRFENSGLDGACWMMLAAPDVPIRFLEAHPAGGAIESVLPVGGWEDVLGIWHETFSFVVEGGGKQAAAAWHTGR